MLRDVRMSAEKLERRQNIDTEARMKVRGEMLK